MERSGGGIMGDVKGWHAPVAVALIVIVISAGFAAGGPQIGLPLGALVAALLIIFAIRQKPFELISPPRPADGSAHILVVIGQALEDADAIDAVSSAVETAEKELAEPTWPDHTEVLVLAPARTGFLDRWATDFRRARETAQRNLVVSIASLAKAHIGAEARVGDQDLVQATEDQLRSFPATRVVLVTGSPETDPRGEQAAAELTRRLAVPLTRVVSG